MKIRISRRCFDVTAVVVVVVVVVDADVSSKGSIHPLSLPLHLREERGWRDGFTFDHFTEFPFSLEIPFHKISSQSQSLFLFPFLFVCVSLLI